MKPGMRQTHVLGVLLGFARPHPQLLNRKSMRFSSLEGKLALMLVAAAVAAAFLSAALATWTGSLWLAAIVAVLACLVPLLWGAHAAMQPVRRLLRADRKSVV